MLKFICKFSSVSGRLGELYHNQSRDIRILLEYTKEYKGPEDIKLGKNLVEPDNNTFNSCFMFVVPLTEESDEHIYTFCGMLHKRGCCQLIKVQSGKLQVKRRRAT